MALPGSLNRYLLLMAQEHLEFRLPVSRPGCWAQRLALLTRRLGGGGVSAGSGARLDWGGDEAAGRTMSPAAFLQDGALPFTPLHVLLAPQLSR